MIIHTNYSIIVLYAKGFDMSLIIQTNVSGDALYLIEVTQSLKEVIDNVD